MLRLASRSLQARTLRRTTSITRALAACSPSVASPAGAVKCAMSTSPAAAARGGAGAPAAPPPGRKAWLVLEDGTALEGVSFGAEREVASEVVFSTGPTGYPEALTDPSFRGQVLVLTQPMIGNYGVPSRTATDAHGLPAFFESDKVHVDGLVVADYSAEYSHWSAASSLSEWLVEHNVPAISGIDTRLLTKKIRDKGALLGKIVFEDPAIAKPASPVLRGPFTDPNKRNLVAEVTCAGAKIYGAGNPVKVLAVDCGMKHHMIRMLVDRGAEVKVVPWDWDLASERDWYDGLFVSNGPGDPSVLKPLIAQLRGIINLPGKPKPIFGICLGNQLLGLAAGATAFKLPFGNRGHNQPVINTLTGEAYITSQNHGFAIDTSTLSAEWAPLFVNANDGTNEGIMHTSKPFWSAQFHPEARGGPEDTSFLFDSFLRTIKEGAARPVTVSVRAPRPAAPKVDKVLVLGSGGLSIGAAGEFDYSGSQAIKAYKEAGKKVVLINPNIASVQTNIDDRSPARPDSVYFLPLTADFIEMVIRRERPDGIVCSMGGQTALNVGIELHKRGVLEKYACAVLGTPIAAVEASEDRQIFNDKLMEIGEKIAKSFSATTVDDAVAAAKEIGFPVMIRSAFALGGLGSGICEDEAKLRDMATKAFAITNQVLVERSLLGWREIEYEVLRDAADNACTVTNMENVDPCGTHTGDSIVVTPSQTLSNSEYHMLRNSGIRVFRHFGIVGEGNIQFALHPTSEEYCIIEINPRLSRSSALASKASGYPLAAVAAKLSLGITLPEITNAITKRTTAFFEPALDYCVVKIPRFDLAKFAGVVQDIGSAMKSVGEVMAIGRTFEEAMQKALRMVDPSIEGFQPRGDWSDKAKLARELAHPTDKRMFAIAYALRHDIMTVEELHKLSSIDRWFLYRLRAIDRESRRIAAAGELSALSQADLRRAKQFGFSDRQIAALLRTTGDGAAAAAAKAPGAAAGPALAAGAAPTAEAVRAPTAEAVRAWRIAAGVKPWVKQIDTLAAEYPAQTNYLYTTYHGSEHDVTLGGADAGGIMVLGSGCYRIGSSVEFDHCSVSAIRTLRQLGLKTTVVNYNPETVSTDYDECDRLYFEELSEERVRDIYEAEAADGVLVSVGGQIPNNLALPLHKRGVKILGTSPEDIDRAEDRGKFSALMDSVGVKQPAWSALTSKQAAFDFAATVGYPVLVRPSYVLSGAAMSVVEDDAALGATLDNAVSVSPEHPVVISKFMAGAQEIDFDGVADRGTIVAHAICEHVEAGGTHSGDATLLLPPQSVSPFYIDQVKRIAAKVAKALNVTGPFNMQLLAKDGGVYIIETNLRASRSFPFVSKTVGSDFIDAATRVMLGHDVASLRLPGLDAAPRPANFVGVKAPMFSFTRLRGADPKLGVEMSSTGEVGCFGANKHEAFLKSLLAANFRLPKKTIFVSSQADALPELVHAAFKLKRLGFELLATPKTAAYLQERDIDTTALAYPADYSDAALAEWPLLRMIKDKKIDLAMIVTGNRPENPQGNFLLRRACADFNVPLLTNGNLVTMFADAMEENAKKPLIGLQPGQLADFYAREKASDAWTSPTEFH